MKLFRSWLAMLSCAAAVILLDQWTKHLMAHAGTIVLLRWQGSAVVSLDVVYNSGMALGLVLWSGFPFVIIGSVAVAVILYLSWQYRASMTSGWYLPVVFGCIIGGIIGNLIDRMTRNGEVLDFIALSVFPVFNLADLFLCLGSILLIRDLYLSSEHIKRG